MERIVATYGGPGHEIHVVEEVDEDAVWYRLVVRNVVINGAQPLAHVPSEDEARAILEQWNEDSGDAPSDQ
ncbi:MAG: hypothetical protein WEB19_04585 [Acidimicrobiia bacterium]